MMRNDTAPCALGLSREQLSAWRDQTLPAAEAQRIARHVPECAACQRRLAQFARIAAAVQQPAPDLRAQTWSGLQARLSQKEQRPMQFPRAAFGGIGAVAALALLAVLFVLVLNQRAGGNTKPGTSSTALSCASALPGSGPASAGSHFTDLPLPAHSVSAAPTQTGGGGDGQFTLYDLELCTSASSPSAVNAFFAGLPASHWQPSNTFPADGAYQSSCGGPYCWAKDARYVSLAEPITDRGGGIERYHLTLAVPPPAPDCSASGNTFSTGYYYQLPNPNYTTTQVYADIPLPPLSRIVRNDASGGQRGYNMCSAGTVASITAFMNAHLTTLGWTSSGNGTWTQNGYILTISIPSPTDWNIGWHDPDLHP
jgi:hypothetical protein